MVIVVTGVAGSGKTTVGRMLAEALHCTYLEGDLLHSPANVDKMSHGVPLTDDDRAPWLSAIHAQIVDAWTRGTDLVVACSALKARYRDVLAEGAEVRWAHLKASPQLIRERLLARTGHFMKVEMLASQFEAWEEPTEGIVVDAGEPTTAIVQRILSAFKP